MTISDFGYSQFSLLDQNFPGLSNPSCSWADFDNDKDVDFAISGADELGNPFTAIYENERGQFVLRSRDFASVKNGKVLWADVDNNGFLDLLVLGEGSENGIFLNKGGILGNEKTALPSFSWCDADFGDYDNDGDLDLLVAGERISNGLYTTRLLQNNKGIFSDIEANLEGMAFSKCKMADLDNDGDLDMVVGGLNKASEPRCLIYINQNGSFPEFIQLKGLDGYGDFDIGDLDGDTDLDIVLARTGGSIVYFNENGSFRESDENLSSCQRGRVKLVDFDNDGDLDIFFSSSLQSENRNLTIYKNKNNKFRMISLNLSTPELASFEWADSDNDGDLDFLLAGVHQDGVFRSQLYFNSLGKFAFEESATKPNGKLTYVETVLDESLPLEAWVDLDGDRDLDLLQNSHDTVKVYLNIQGNFIRSNKSQAHWVDLDNDLDRDLVVSHNSKGESFKIQIYRNDESELVAMPQSSLVQGEHLLSFADADEDVDIDILISSPKGNFKKMFSNQLSDTKREFFNNDQPQKPYRTFARVSQNDANLIWQPSVDDNTPTKAISYELRVGLRELDQSIVSLQSPIEARRSKDVIGNAGQNNQYNLKRLSPGKYYWSVRAIDQSMMYSDLSRTDSFEVIKNLNCVVLNTNNKGYGSLRAAIDCANKNYGSDTITFNLSGNGPYIFKPLTPYPRLKNLGTVINGTSQANFKSGDLTVDGELLLSTSSVSSPFTDPNSLPAVLGIQKSNLSQEIFVFASDARSTEYVPSIPLRTFDSTALFVPAKRINLTDLFIGVNYNLIPTGALGKWGFSVYYPLGFYVNGIQRFNDELPLVSYSEGDLEEARRQSQINGDDYSDFGYASGRKNLKASSFGIYGGINKNLYLKIGYSLLQGHVWNEYAGSVEPDYLRSLENGNYAVNFKKVNSSNIQLGAALVFPFIQVEGGFDFLYEQPFLSVGSNFPLRRVRNIFSLSKQQVF